MEYLVIIAFVGLIIFKAIKKGKSIIEDEMHKTMLPGKRSVSTTPDSEESYPSGSGNEPEEWFGNYHTEEKILMGKPKVLPKIKTPTKITKKESAATPVQSPAKPDQHIRLNSKEEARRAIIYSEIFKRKY